MPNILNNDEPEARIEKFLRRKAKEFPELNLPFGDRSQVD